jgi:hypothetical protein
MRCASACVRDRRARRGGTQQVVIRGKELERLGSSMGRVQFQLIKARQGMHSLLLIQPRLPKIFTQRPFKDPRLAGRRWKRAGRALSSVLKLTAKDADTTDI